MDSDLIENHGQEWSAVRRELDNHLYRITRVVPDGPLASLRKVTIWIHWSSPETRCMAYHPGPEWLRDHKMNPDMAKGIEIGDAKNFLSWTYEQPWMVLHELAHAYHDQFTAKGFSNDDIRSCYDEAMSSKKYESILHWNGTLAKHYACTNPMEYFAESTESYFGANDFYPFGNAELRTYDPKTFELMKRVWGVPQKRL